MTDSRLLRPAILAGLLVLGGCMVGPDYTAPAHERETARLSSTETPEADAAGIASGIPVIRDWWATLRDPELESLVERLFAQNLDLKTAESRVREARALRGIAAAPLYPALGLVGNVGPAGSGDKFHSSNSYSVGFDATWEIDVFGGLRRGVEAADANIEVAVEARRDTLVSLLGELGRNYIELRGEQRQLEIARRNVELQEQTLALVTVRKRTGLASDLQVSQAATQLQTTRADVPRLETILARSIFRVSVLLGLEPRALAAELSPPARIPEVPPTIPVGVPSQLLTRRPDLRRAEKAMAAASAQVGVATADLYPKFALTGNIQYATSTIGGPTGPSFYVGPSVSWPIFDGFQVVSNIRVQDARLEQAILAYRQAVLIALEDVENALTAYAKELIRRETLTEAAHEAEKAEGMAQTQYKNGLVDFLNVVTAQGTLAASQQELVLSEETLLVDLIAVYKALGGGWDVFEERAADLEQQAATTELPR
jgi:NodT family efflux transporter outer membrane factor (OMF) lipoprotein